jgi:hypothetical protein
MAQHLRILESLWAMERRRADTAEWPLQTQLATIPDAGFAGAGVRFIDPDFAGEVTSFLRDHGNLTCAVLPDRRRRSETGAGCTATPACSPSRRQPSSRASS